MATKKKTTSGEVEAKTVKKAVKKVATKKAAKKVVKKAAKKVVKRATKASSSPKTLIIAEKPSVAKDLIGAIGGTFKDNKTYHESDSYIVSFAVGHLVTICAPPEIDERLKAWSLDNLPIVPEKFPLKQIERSKSQLNAVSKLIKRKDVVEIVNACDAGREGELIFRYILQYVIGDKENTKSLKRLWLQSMTKTAIQDGMKNLREDHVMKNLEAAAMSRSEADWLVGINGSRALTSWRSRFGGFRLTPCGRVQTPTLSMIVDRENQRREFIPVDYWEVQGKFTLSGKSYIGKWIDPEHQKDPADPHKKPERIWDKEKAENIVSKCKGKEAEVTETSKPSSQSCPPLYDLTSIQREANSRFGLSAKRTLEVMQRLYERHKVITYPRTGSRCLPEDYIPSVKNIAGVLTKGELGPFAKKLLDEGWVKPSKKIFNDAKVTDHHAVIPTDVLPSGLEDMEAKVYKMIVQRFLGVFYPPARFLNTTRISVVEEETFKTEGKVLKDPGWKAIYGSQEEEETLVPLDENVSVHLAETLLEENETKPPARFTESSLLSMMEGAGKLVEDEELRDAMKEGGLGTPATRAAIIEGLINDKYVSRQGKELWPTTKAMELLETIAAMKLDELASPELTGAWETRLEKMSQGEISREEFMKGIGSFAGNIVQKVKAFDEDADVNRKKSFFHEGIDKQFFETLSYYETEDKDLRIRRFMGGRYMLPEEIKELVSERKIGPLTGFMSKAGKPFTAMIRLKEENKVEFVFEDPMEEVPDFNTLPLMGVSPTDGTNVYEGEVSYVSTSAYDKESKTGLKINKVILGKAISPDNMKKMLQGEKTDLIQGFQSSKTKRFFDAYLSLSNKGKISFSFPPRGYKKKGFKKDKSEEESS